MKGIVIVNAYTKSEGALRQSNRIAEELNARGACVRIEKNGNFFTDNDRSKIRTAEAPDFVVYLDKDKYLPRMLEKKGVPPAAWSYATIKCLRISHLRKTA